MYVDDVIVGSTGTTWDELVANHDRALRAVMARLAHHDQKVEPKKAQLFIEEIECCGHIMQDGRRWPSPGKLMAVQKWQLPLTVSQLLGFMGVTNYYSGYVPHKSHPFPCLVVANIPL